jgi:hypothetical protein
MTVESKRYSLWLQGFVASVGAALLVVGCTDPGDDVQDPDGTPPVGTAAQAATASPNGLSIQLLDKADIAGNARVTVTSIPAGQEVAPPSIVVGLTENPIILRDDGVGADVRAQDRIYSAFAFVNPADLDKRRTNEINLITTQKIQSVPTFSDRAVTGSAAPAVFDLDNFNRLVAVPFNPSTIFAPAFPSPASSLLINNVNVVTPAGDPTRTWDPCSNTGTQLGAFTFGRLMTEMANQPLTGITPAAFTMQWLQKWQVNQNVNTFNVPARPNITTTIINPWLAASGGVSLNLGLAPFRLLAIVNRLDLRTGGGGYAGSTGDAGELRFVFGAVVPGTTCQLLPFTVIFEYGVPIRGCVGVRSWAQQWVALSSMVIGSPAYNAALQALTDQVVLRNKAPAKPNGSALNQLRTNEIAIGSPWELREFKLINPISFLNETPVFRTPAVKFNAQDPGWVGGGSSTVLDSFMLANLVAINNGTYTIPLSFGVTPFQGGASPVTANNLNYFWKASTLGAGFNNERFTISLNTCNGCHAGETKTIFTHISPTTPLGSPAALSGFLTGINVLDPAFGAPLRNFNDLARRQADLVSVANSACLSFPRIDPALLAVAQRGEPLPRDLVSQPVAPVSEQGTFFVEDFFKTSLQGH